MHISHLPQLNALQNTISYGEGKAKMCFSCCYFWQFGLLFLCWCSCKSKFHNRNSPKLGKSILLSPLQPLHLRKIGKITYIFVDFYFKTCFVFNWGGIKPRRTPDKEVRPNPLQWILCQPALICTLNLVQSTSKNSLASRKFFYMKL